MAESNPFDYVKSIQKTKVDMIRGKEPEAVKGYVPFLTNRALSFYPDSVLIANEMNTKHWLDPDEQYAFHLNSVRKMDRKHSWIKKVKDEDIADVSRYFSCNVSRASEMLAHLSPEDMKSIRKSLTGGGTVKK
jgi:hypothetical protein